MQLPLKEIITYAEPKMRYILSNAFVQVCANQKAFLIYQDLQKLGTVRTLLPALFIAVEIAKEASHERVALLIKHSQSFIFKKMGRDYKRGNFLRPCVAGLQSIFQAEELTIDEKFNLSKTILSLSNTQDQMNQWLLVQGLSLSSEMAAVSTS